MRKYRHILAAFVLLILPTVLVAGPRSRAEAVAVARAFWSKSDAARRAPLANSAIRLVTASEGEYYLFAPAEAEGFVLVGGDDCLPEVLAYGQKGRPTAENLPEGVGRLLSDYARLAREGRAPSTTRTSARTVAPLLASVRHQEMPYNGMCPYYTYDDGTVSTERTLVGCVATAVEQIMSYYRHPQMLADTLHGWTTAHYSLDDVMPGTRIDWANVLPRYDEGIYSSEQARAVQELSLYCGMGCEMNYGVNASGANLGDYLRTLRRVFSYEYVRFHGRSLYTPSAWTRLIRHELEAGRPVAYAGFNVELSGHAFVVDGVDADGFYHVNWGYGGDYDGWFDLDVLNPFERLDDPTEDGRSSGFFCNQTALFMHPQPVDELPADTLDFEAGDVTFDGVHFPRRPETSGYSPVHFLLTNHRADTLTYTFEVLTNLVTETAHFEQAEYVALTAATLPPGQQTTVTTYCRFGRAGTFELSVSDDDETRPLIVPVTVEKAPTSALAFTDLALDEVTSDGTARFTLRIANQAAKGWNGQLVTYSLTRGDDPVDYRHWTFLDLEAGATMTDTVHFRNLIPGERYTLRVRCPWTVVAEQSIVLPAATSLVLPEVFEVSDSYTAVCSSNGRLLRCFVPAVSRRTALHTFPAGFYLLRTTDGRYTKVIHTP